MKKFVFATLMCIAAMSAKAQVITSEAIQKAYDNDKYSVAYSRYNAKTNSFDAPIDKMVYSLHPYADVTTVTSYHRDNSTLPFQLISEIQVTESPVLFAEK